MAVTLIERIRRARRTGVESKGRSFTVRRPTDLEMLELFKLGNIRQGEILSRFVVDWGEMKEIDLIPGGGPDLVPFEPALFAEWIADHPEHWDDLTNGVIGAYQTHEAEVQSAAKNSTPGLIG